MSVVISSSPPSSYAGSQDFGESSPGPQSPRIYSAVDFGLPRASMINFDAEVSNDNSLKGDQDATNDTADASGSQQQLVAVVQQLLEMIMAMLQQLFGDNTAAPPIPKNGQGSAGSAPHNLEKPTGGPAPAPNAGAPSQVSAGRGDSSNMGETTESKNALANSKQFTSVASGDLHLPEALGKYEQDIRQAAETTGMPPEVIAGMIWAESRGDSNAKSSNPLNGQTDSGLMQVNPNTAKQVRKEHPNAFQGNDMSTPQNQIMMGALYLADQHKGFNGDMKSALRAYNSGPDGVDRSNYNQPANGIGDPNYVINVIRFANTIATGSGNLDA